MSSEQKTSPARGTPRYCSVDFKIVEIKDESGRVVSKRLEQKSDESRVYLSRGLVSCVNEGLARSNERLYIMEGRGDSDKGLKRGKQKVTVGIKQNLHEHFKDGWNYLYIAQPISRLYANISTLLQWIPD